MNSIIEDIRLMLEAESSLGLVFNDNLFLYREPAKPINSVTLFEAPGMPPVGLLGSNEDSKHYERPALQVRIRNVDPQAAFQQGLEISNALHARANEVWGDYYYALIYTTTQPYMLDWTDGSNIRVLLNFNIQRRLI